VDGRVKPGHDANRQTRKSRRPPRRTTSDVTRAETATLPASAVGRAKGDLSAPGQKGVRKDARLPTGYGPLQKARLLLLALAARLPEAFGVAEWDVEAFAFNDLRGGQDLQL
jgi:hypothetical protein